MVSRSDKMQEPHYISPELEGAPCFRAMWETCREIARINWAFKDLLHNKEATVLIAPPEVLMELGQPCRDRENFERKIGMVYILLEMNLDQVRKLVPNYDGKWKGLTLLRHLFKNHSLLTQIVSQHMEFLRKVVNLRNKVYPYHRPSSREGDELMAELGLCQSSSKEEWRRNWDKLANGLLSSFCTIRCALESLIQTEEVT